MTRRNARWVRFLVVAMAALATLSYAHVGAPDVYLKTAAGPYQLQISVHPPAASPGAAGVDVRTEDTAVSAVSASLPGAPPQPLQRFSAEQIFMGSVWVASGGAWRVVIHVTGSKGEAEITLPIPAASDTTKGIRRLNRPQWWGLGLAALAGIAMLLFHRSRTVTIAAWATVGVVFVVATVFALRNPTPPKPRMQVAIPSDGRLEITLPGKMDDLVEDHGHLMHLFAVRQPEMDVLLHLHPEQTSPGHFVIELPSMAPGAFLLFADVVHRNGSLETFAAQAGLPAVSGHVLRGDDSVGIVPGLSRALPFEAPGSATSRLMDGYSMRLEVASPLHPRSGQLLQFALLDPAGDKPADMQLYMGMTAHAAVLNSDGTVFAHIHPAGTIAMAPPGQNMAVMDMASAPQSEVAFPFGFPSAGSYRIFVQMKHGGVVETGAFDLLVR